MKRGLDFLMALALLLLLGVPLLVVGLIVLLRDGRPVEPAARQAYGSRVKYAQRPLGD